MTIKLIICGASGRVGTLLDQLASKDKEWQLTAKIDSKHPLSQSSDTGDVIIDFSLPAGTDKAIAFARENKIPIVIGTTGLNEAQKNRLAEAAKEIPVVFSPNMSVGVNVLFKLISVASQALGNPYSVAISETHHVHKKDTPSGTAKKMGELVEKNAQQLPPIESIREGEVVGDHTIVFGSDTEQLTLSHRALDRKVFAEGALRAARWVIGKSPGLYNMADVLGFGK